MNIFAEKARLMKFATFASVAIASIIVIIKFIAWSKTDSLAIFSSLVDSFLDLFVSAINFAAVRYALLPPDHNHKFGHGKAEDIAALVQTAFIIGSAFYILIEAVQKFTHPTELHEEMVGVWMMVASTVLAMALVAFQQFVSKRTNSPVVAADSYHYLTDIFSNGIVIASLIITKIYGISWVDPLLAIAVSLYIFSGAIKIGLKSFNNLMDHEFDESERQRIKDIVLSHPGVRGVHDLRTRASGIRSFIQMHIELDGDIKLKDAHVISDQIEKQLEQEFQGADVMIHQDPKEKYV